MAEITLTAHSGRPTGSSVARRLRAEGKVPGVVYGLAADPTPVTVEWRELRTVLTTDAGLNALIDLTVDGDTKLSIVKDLQRDPIRHTVEHVDFLLIRRDQAITVDVPIVLTGEAEDVVKGGGMVDQVIVSLSVAAMPADIPNEINIDISELQIGDAVRVGDLPLPAGVTTEVDAEEPVVTASIVQIEVPEPEAAAGAGEEGEAGEGAEGEGGEPGAGAGDASAEAEGGDES